MNSFARPQLDWALSFWLRGYELIFLGCGLIGRVELTGVINLINLYVFQCLLMIPINLLTCLYLMLIASPCEPPIK